MRCPYCGSKDTKVIDKRDSSEEPVTRRRRECLKCFKRFTTYERIEKIDLTVVKSDGTSEMFSREKLKKSILKATANSNVTDQQIYGIVEDIEMRLLNRKSTMVRSKDIGRLVLNRLKNIDPIVYMRFASVYKGFNSLDDFIKEIDQIQKR